jgi:hypothetical protein
MCQLVPVHDGEIDGVVGQQAEGELALPAGQQIVNGRR